MTRTADGIHIAIRLTPRSRAEAVDGIVGGMLKVAVTAPPVDNQANEALLRLLAKRWRLPRRDLSIVGGAKGRNKIVRVAGVPAELMARLAPLIK
ncbi:MAG TPA: DUF167 domain-containing protein [Stellaceae bacterium]|nr:DUF167 domain-containing protein [Stellaceae bacterium]